MSSRHYSDDPGDGTVRAWGVNPNRDEVAGMRCYPSVAALPETPECAFLMVNHERVETSALSHLDEIQVGRFVLLLLVGGAEVHA